MEKSEGEWKKELDQFSFQVLRKKGTEPAGTGEYDKFYPTEGHFVCKGCGNPLYSAESKFNSGCGWCVARFPRRRFPPPRSTTPPSPRLNNYTQRPALSSSCLLLHLSRPAFDKCYEGSIITETDMTFGMKRVEIMCAACDGHLGHVFENEGFTPTMERHCVNSVSVKYVEGPPETLLEEAKVSNGEGAGGSFNRLLFPLVMLGLAYALSGVMGKIMDFFMSKQMLG